jgi:hypothetical protein
MSEEKEGGSIKGAVIGGITLLITTVTGVVATKFESIFGSKEETPTEVQAPATQQPQIVINNAQTQAQQAGGGKTVIIKEKSAEPVKEKPKAKTEKEALAEEPKW